MGWRSANRIRDLALLALVRRVKLAHLLARSLALTFFSRSLFSLRGLPLSRVCICSLRTIDSFAFHQDLGILSATCIEALTDILTWAKVWVTVILIYACVGTLWFAYADPLFASFSTSVTSLAYMSLLILADPQRLMTQGFLLQLYVWSFIALNTVLLFNVMLAILWKAFEKVKEERRTTLGLSVSTSFRLFRYAVAYDLEHYYWRHLRGAAAALCSKNAAAAAVSPPPQAKLAALRARRGSGSKDGAWLSFQDMLSDVALEARVLSTQRQIQGRPHTHKERLELLRSGTAVDIPSFLMRRELAQLYRDHALVDALVQVLRFRTAAHAPSQVLRRTGDPTVLILSRLARLEMRVERWRAAARTASSSAKRDQTTSTSPAWPSSPTSSTAPDTPPTSTSPAWPSSPTSSPLPDAPQPRAACAATPIHAPEPVSPHRQAYTVGERAAPARGLPPHLDWQSSATPSQNG
jgi:hypothetical protein